MQINEMLSLLHQGRRPYHLAGTIQAGIIVLPDLEGRIYTIWDGQILNRVNPRALTEVSHSGQYHNPGGDGFWPAPEGTRLGYHYATGSWRVPAAVRHARYRLTASSENAVSVESEIDLINAQGLGIPTLFRRQIEVSPKSDNLDVRVRDSIHYLGNRSLKTEECLLSPWSLCQFDCNSGCEVIFPGASEDTWELYSGRTDVCTREGPFCHAGTGSAVRYQLGISARVPWIEFCDPVRRLAVRRQAEVIPANERYIDIRDADPMTAPDHRGIRYSVYYDPAGFMKIEAAGGCPVAINPGTILTLDTKTCYSISN